MPGDTEAEKVEEADRERDRDRRSEDAWVGDGLLPAAWEVKKRRALSDRWEKEWERCEEQDRECAEEALPAYGDERSDRVRRHDFLLNDELCCGAAIATGTVSGDARELEKV